MAKKSLGKTGDPKAEAGSQKATLQNISAVALLMEAEVMRGGSKKYGAYNWCEHPMRASTYHDAILRHFFAWWTGEDIDPESGLSHMAHLRACTGILLEQAHTGELIDDRPLALAPIGDLLNIIANRNKLEKKDARPHESRKEEVGGPRQ